LKKPKSISEADTTSQKQIFYELYEFALKICIRYTSCQNEPEQVMYEGFARLFRNARLTKFVSLQFLQKKIKEILISICIEREKKKIDLEKDSEDELFLSREPRANTTALSLSDKQIIDILRTIPFVLRAAYNMSVIDGFDDQRISLMLGIPISSVQYYLSLAREQLSQLLQHTTATA
jgi:DNA-directed RNA polymerase specialized sigma24 family protein